MLLLASCNDLAGRHVECGEQVERRVADAVVGLSLGLAEVRRQDRLRTLESLNLRCLVEGEHDRVVRQVPIL
jgi:hypothetical protein